MTRTMSHNQFDQRVELDLGHAMREQLWQTRPKNEHGQKETTAGTAVGNMSTRYAFCGIGQTRCRRTGMRQNTTAPGRYIRSIFAFGELPAPKGDHRMPGA